MEQAKWDRRRFRRCRAGGWLSGWIDDGRKVSIADVSMGGVLIEHPSTIRPGPICLLRLSLRGERVRVQGRVVRSAIYRYEAWPPGERTYVYRTGLELLDVAEVPLQVIGGYIGFLEAEMSRYRNRHSVLTRQAQQSSAPVPEERRPREPAT
jgi:hypothetical protein